MSETQKNYLTEVRNQYEELPYPERNPEDEKKRLILSFLCCLDTVNHHCFKGQQDFNNFRVLIAGGGSGDAAIAWAEQLREKKNSEVIYLDMSNTSMNIAKERAKIRKLDNIKWINDSLLNIPSLNLGEFDFINCTGVIHHLEEPKLGLDTLKSVLKVDGAMELMVYATFGRMGIYPLQDLMRVINKDEEDTQIKINNTKKILKSLPDHNWFNMVQNHGWVFTDTDNDAGIYDLLLHSQDRSYTILELHNLLESCDMRITSEPGANYQQTHYLPKTFIDNKSLLDIINLLPLKNQQYIAENMSNKITMHDCFVIHNTTEDRIAKIQDTDLIPYCGGLFKLPLNKLADAAEQHDEELVATLSEDNTNRQHKAIIPSGNFIPLLLRQIDGEHSVEEIINSIKNHPDLKGNDLNIQEIMNEFQELFMSLNRGHFLFLRDKSTLPCTPLSELENRVKLMYS